MKNTWRRLLSMMLSVVMVLSLTVPSYAANDPKKSTRYSVEWGKVEDGTTVTMPRKESSKDIEIDPAEFLPKGNVRVSIVLSDAPTLDKYAVKSIGQNSSAMQYRNTLEAKQESVKERISREVLGGRELDVVWNMTLAANIISANVPSSKIEEIKEVPGVEDVVVEMRYEPCAPVSTDKPTQIVATDMIGATGAWSANYTGAGSKVAIIDTGLDTDHQLFDPDAFEYAIEQTGKDVDLLEESEVSSAWSGLNAAGFINSADGVYLNAKVPFAVNYVDRDLDVTHDHDTQGEHGSHVAGIAAGNRYIKNGSGYDEALETVLTQGAAPDAQLIIMKVFGKGGGAYDSDYMVAIEDAIMLGADSINLSLGSSVAGFPANSNETYAAILDNLSKKDAVVTISAGNNGSWADMTTYGYLYGEGANLHTGGSPGTYANAFTIASVDNDGIVGVPMKFNGESIFFTESTGDYGNAPIKTLVGTHEFVFIANEPGEEEAGFAAVADLLKGKIAICTRGGSSFFEKANAAIANGAIATIIVNNQPGTFGMNLTGYEYTAPAVSITQADGEKIKAGATSGEANGVPYYTGEITIQTQAELSEGAGESEYKTMSDFSSWGVPGDLSLKPEITAPGGNIWSANGAMVGGEDYESMSGTSMAAPQVAGLVAVFAQYLREEGIEAKDLNTRGLIQSLLMSTAEPLVEEDSGNYYSVLKQGAGLANVESAMNARTYIQMQEVLTAGEATKVASAAASMADGKVKAELGDDPDRTGEYEVTFTVNNLSDEPMGVAFNGEFFTQDVFADSGMEFLDTWTTPIEDCEIEWLIDGEPYETDENIEYDFNDDGVFDHQDAQALLDKIVKDEAIINEDVAKGLDGDAGSLSTRDAYICLTMANEASAVIQPEESITVTAKISLFIPEELDDNGNYVEGFLFVKEGESSDGAAGVEHSIPVLGYWGSWSEPSMYDIGSALEYEYEEEGRPPYLYAALKNSSLNANTYLVQYAGDKTAYAFGGNPYLTDTDMDGNPTYYPERNAMRSDSTISKVQYSLIRNRAAARFTVADENGAVMDEYTKTGSEAYAAYYYPNQGAWQGTVSNMRVDFKPEGLETGTALLMNLDLAPHYYVNNGEVDWDALYVMEEDAPYKYGTHFSMPVVIDDLTPEIVDMDVLDIEGEDYLAFYALDNLYMAVAGLFNENGELLNAYGSNPEAEPETPELYGFPLSAVNAAAEEAKQDDDETNDFNPNHLMVLVADYAGNENLYYINLTLEEEIDDPDTLLEASIEPAEYVVIAGKTQQLPLSVKPWAIDYDAEWTSDNPDVATVDANGVVTGVAAGDAKITATVTSKMKEGTAKAEALIHVIEIDKDLNGIVWDEEGEVWVSAFNLNALPDYTKLHQESLDLPIASAAYDQNGTLYAASLDSDNFLSDLYTMDPETFELTKVGGSAEVAYMDLAAAPSLGDGLMLAAYGPYALIVDTATGDYLGAFNYSEDIEGENLVGIALETTFEHPNYGPVDVHFLLDDAGNLYEDAYVSIEGEIYDFGIEKVAAIGDPVDTPYFQSLYFDGECLYWSRFDSVENDVDMILVDFSVGEIYDVGSFDTSVWPVGGLFELGVNPANGFNQVGTVKFANAEINKNAVFTTEIQPISLGSSVTKGGLNAVTGSAGTMSTSRTEMVKKISADEATVDIKIDAKDLAQSAENVAHNGLYVVKYDPNKLTYKSTSTTLPYTSYLADEEAGTVTFAFADLDGLKAKGVAATVHFEPKSNNSTGVLVTTEELNEIEPELVIPAPVVVDPTPSQPSTPDKPSEPSNPGDELPFVDVHKSDYFYDDVAYLYNAGFISGTSATTFSPNLPITRGMIVTIIWRVTGSPAAQGACPFKDVAPGMYYEQAIAWAAEKGIVTGYDATTFGPDDSITREQLAAILYRYGQFRGVQPVTGSIDGFADADQVSAYAREPMAWAVGSRIMNGVGNNMLNPKGTATRAQAAAMINRFINNAGYQPTVYNNTQRG